MQAAITRGAAPALLLQLLLCRAAAGSLRAWAVASGRARAVANLRPGHLGAMAALRGGMHDREQDIEAFTAKQLALVELECAAEETAAAEEQQSFTLKQLEVPGPALLAAACALTRDSMPACTRCDASPLLRRKRAWCCPDCW